MTVFCKPNICMVFNMLYIISLFAAAMFVDKPDPHEISLGLVVTCLSDSVLSGMLLSSRLDSTFVEMVLAIVALSSNTLFIRVPAFLGDVLFSKYSFLSLLYQCLQGHEFQVLVVHR